ncbi:MAG: NAD-dependent epimerase/dehydratase family protein [Ferruginibacter sp.]
MSNEFPRPGKILVTGGAGLLGKELITQLLSLGKDVTAIYNNTSLENFSFNGLKTVQCNILDVIGLEEAMEGIDELYHCAGKVSFAPTQVGHLYKVNVEGTSNVVNAALNAGVRKMLHVSSVSALGRIREGEIINENMQWTEETSNSKYGQSKYMGEMEVWRGIAEGLNAVIVNPTIILGTGNWNESSTEIFKAVYNGSPWYAEGTTGFVDVKDVARIMIMLMESEISSERFIISAENKSYHDLFDQIADAFNKKRPSRKVTALLASIVWRWEAIKSKFTGAVPLITKETAATAMTKVRFDNSKLKKYFPSFEYHGLEQTIKTTCSALQQKLNNH